MTAHEIAGRTLDCEQHGQYIGMGDDCPVCAGRSIGRTWTSVCGNPRREPADDEWERTPTGRRRKIVRPDS